METKDIFNLTYRLISAGPSGELGDNRLSDEARSWTNDAYREILMDQEWSFMRVPFDIQVFASPSEADAIYVKSTADYSGEDVSYSTDPIYSLYYGLVIPLESVGIVTIGYGRSPIQKIIPLVTPDDTRYVLTNDIPPITISQYGDLGDADFSAKASRVPELRIPDYHGRFDAKKLTKSMPTKFMMGNDGGLVLNCHPPEPSDQTGMTGRIIRIRCDCITEPEDLYFGYESGSQPVIPDKYRSLISYRAAAMYCEQRGDTERYAPLQMQYLGLLQLMRDEHLPQPTFDGSIHYR